MRNTQDILTEAERRDLAVAATQVPGDNHFNEIVRAAMYFIRTLEPGARFTAGQLRHAVTNFSAAPTPRESRVYGAVMRELAKLGMIERAGVSTLGRSHRGLATDWRRT